MLSVVADVLWQVFPVDYLLVVVLLAFLFFSTMEGLQSLGVWCLCVRVGLKLASTALSDWIRRCRQCSY